MNETNLNTEFANLPWPKQSARGGSVGLSKTTSTLRLLVLLLLTLPAVVQAQFNYAIMDDAITITGYTGPGGTVTIPATIDGLPVTRIGNGAFRGFTSLTSLTIPNSVTSIEAFAFDRCTHLASVNIPGSVTSIGYLAFVRCSRLTAFTVEEDNSAYGSVDGVLFDKNLTTLIQYPEGRIGGYTIPGTVTSLQTYAFNSNFSLTGITIPDSVTSIGEGAFGGCTSLTSVTIPSGVTSIGGQAFDACTNLMTITVDDGNLTYSSADGILFDKTQTTLFQYPGGKSGSYIIPTGVTSFGNNAFSGCTRLTSVAIPSGVSIIPYAAFSGCTSLTSVTIPSGVVSIGIYAFSGCTSLASVSIPSSTSSISSDAFTGCTNLAAITVNAGNSGYSSANGVLFNNTRTMLILCPEGKTGSYTIPGSVTIIGGYAFGRCVRLTGVTIPNSVTSIEHSAFEECTHLTTVTIPDRIASIANAAFKGCSSLTSVTIGSGVTSILGGAFDHCSSLTSVTIPSRVTSVEEGAFAYCTRLAAINVNSGNSTYMSVDGVLFNRARTTLIEFPGGKSANYTIPSGVTRIRNHAFLGCTNLATVTIPNGVKSIEAATFGDCTSLASVTIPSSVTSIGLQSFYNCSGLTRVTIPDRVTNLGYLAFQFCTSLERVYFRGDAPSADPSAFEGSNAATVYYLAETAGWGPSLGGRPTALWQPEVQASDGGFGIRTNQFGFNITWASGRVVVVEACANLSQPTWSVLGTHTLTDGSYYFSDPDWVSYSARFYRLRSP